MIRCPVCAGTDLADFVNRSAVPSHQNLLMSDADAARAIVRGDLDMSVCGHCGFVFNRSFDLSRVSYGPNYDNTQTCSGYFDGYLDGLVADLVESHGVRDCTIVEVGCGKGHFLRKLVAYPGSGNRGLGFDPTYVGPDSDLDGRLSFYRRFYNSQCAEMKADVVVCRHVIEHVPDPMAILRAVHAALAGSPKAKEYAAAEAGLRRKWCDSIKKLGEQGRVALWGARAKGATLANLIDSDRTLIEGSSTAPTVVSQVKALVKQVPLRIFADPESHPPIRSPSMGMIIGPRRGSS